MRKALVIQIIVFVFCISAFGQNSGWIRFNQLGYLPKSVKVAVFISTDSISLDSFALCDAITGNIVFQGKLKPKEAEGWGMKTAYRLNFSKFEKQGGYYITVGKTASASFRINTDVYNGTADFILNYMRQQRCGYNPYLKDSCHLFDGIIVDHPIRSGEHIDVTGGWHDASDYLQYSTTSVNAIYQMLFAYSQFPENFNDQFSASGEVGSNNIPDILDEIKWGLNWMLKMNPAKGEMYNQIADDRDHRGFRLPNKDSATYGLEGTHRPVYYVTGKPQGLAKYKNQSTGVSSIAGKFASAFALGSFVLSGTDSEYALILKEKAIEAYEYALTDTGYCQTACNVSPYFYEESNYADDLELAACELHRLTDNEYYLNEAVKWGKREPVTPWIEKGDARHYQYYPFVNMGHSYLAKAGAGKLETLFDNYYNKGLSYLYERGKDDPFFYGLPFIWCSNNLAVGALTQSRLYQESTNHHKYVEMEASIRDWLFGCNPWGTAMICGLPGVEDSPMIPHSSITVLLGETTFGGLVDGPVYSSIYNNLLGIKLSQDDEYKLFQNGKAVYHDDPGDYSTNEPTMDGTASLSYYLASLETEGRKQAKELKKEVKDSFGATIRNDISKKIIYLTFTADSYFEGGQYILNVLEKHGIKASFFFTGNFLRNKEFTPIVWEIKKQGHYIGIHSDKHLLYNDWQKRDSLLVTHHEFVNDVRQDFMELQRFGITNLMSPVYVAPYEWYNQKIIDWSRQLGLNVVNFTPGIGTNADYTTPNMKNYKSSDELLEKVLKFENENLYKLNGAILLIHPGTDPDRTDKFYNRLDDLLKLLKLKGYGFQSFKK